MGTESGYDFAGLMADLEKHGPQYNFFQAVYLAEIITRQWHPARKDFALDQAGLRFRPREHYVFPPNDIYAIARRGNNLNFVLNFMGLYGVNSPLPRCYHEQITAQKSVRSGGQVPLQDFLDIFNNRFYWLYYQAWKKYRYYLQLDENAANHLVSQRVFAFVGGALPRKQPASLKTTTAVSPFTLWPFSGLLTNRVRSKTGLLILLAGFFPRFKCKIKEFVPHLVQLAEVPPLGGPRAARLGENAVAGRAKLDYMSRICIEIGPLEFSEYLDFTPGAGYARLLQQLLGLYLNDGLEYDVKFTIRSASLVTVPWNDPRLRLGFSIWLGKPKEEFVQVSYSHEQYNV